MIKARSILVSKEPRDANRTLEVLAVFPAELFNLKKTYAVCSSRGRITTFDVERLMDPSRFEVLRP